MNKMLIVFAVAVALPVGLQLLAYLANVIFYYPFRTSSFDLAFNLLFTLAKFFGAFALFFYCGKTTQIRVVMPIVLALFFGILVGYLVSSLPFYTAPSTTVYLAMIGDFTSGFIGFTLALFFPALAALLFAELRAKKS